MWPGRPATSPGSASNVPSRVWRSSALAPVGVHSQNPDHVFTRDDAASSPVRRAVAPSPWTDIRVVVRKPIEELSVVSEISLDPARGHQNRNLSRACLPKRKSCRLSVATLRPGIVQQKNVGVARQFRVRTEVVDINCTCIRRTRRSDERHLGAEGRATYDAMKWMLSGFPLAVRGPTPSG